MRLHVWIAVALLGLAWSAPAGAMAPDKILDSTELAARIDQLVAKRIGEKAAQAAPLADDAEFVRRIYLDLVGRIPRAAETREFLADKRGDKRQRLIHKLLSEPLYVTHLSTTWRSILLPPTNAQVIFANPAFKMWTDKQVQENVPYDRMVREILTVPVAPGPRGPGVIVIGGPGQAATPSPAGFYQANE